MNLYPGLRLRHKTYHHFEFMLMCEYRHVQWVALIDTIFGNNYFIVLPNSNEYEEVI